MMKKVLKPYWLLLTAAIPQLILAAVFYKLYYIVRTELNNLDKLYWEILARAFGVMILLTSAYAVYKIVKKRSITAVDAIVVLVFNIAFLYVLLWNYDYIIPGSFSNWMFFDINPLFTISGCFMPVLMYCIVALAANFMPKEKYKPWWNLGALVIMPLFYYLLVIIAADIDFLWGDNYVIFENVLIILLIAASITFMFLSLRLIYYFYNKKKVSKIIIGAITGLLLPLAGLIINQLAYNILGDFSSAYFYAAAVLTGALIILPDFKDIKIRIIVFFLKSVCLVYTVYFFIVFLPFVPLAIMATVAMGLGFLLLAPTLLLLVHLKSLAGDFKAVKEHFRNKNMTYATVLIFMVGILVIPTSMVVSFIIDKQVINNVLEYVYEEGYNDTTIKINHMSLKRVLGNLERTVTESRGLELYEGTPYITGLYREIVLDNSTISEDKRDLLREIFLNTEIQDDESQDSTSQIVSAAKIKDYYTETVYDEELGYYKSWLHLNIIGTGNARTQYFTSFTLPEGCYISDYYLYVDDVKKMGIITDKRAANWIYQQIVTVRRDPGVLTYISDDVVNFRVFPVWQRSTRDTGIEFVHAEPVVITIDGIEISLDGEQTIDTPVAIGDCIEYIPAEAKKNLTPIMRMPQYNFVIDCSKEAKGKTEEYIERAVSIAQQNGLDESEFAYYMTNYNVKQYFGDDDVDTILRHIDYSGGFFADRAVKRILLDNYLNTKKTYPVIVLITDDIESAILLNNYEAIEYTFPDSEYIYFWQPRGLLISYSLLTGETMETTFAKIGKEQKNVLFYPDESNVQSYISSDYEGQVLISGIIDDDLLGDVEGSKWKSGIVLEAMNMEVNMRIANTNQTSLQIIQGSIISRVMTPLSSFIVVETEMQEKALLEKQESLLSSEKQYLSEVSMELTEMSEPPLWLMMVGLIALAAYKHRRSRKISIQKR